MASKSRKVAGSSPLVAEAQVSERSPGSRAARQRPTRARPLEHADVTIVKPKACEPPLVKVDLGCGAIKREGFVGVDRFPMPGVDVVCDVDDGIPLEDDSVDYLLASHSLEHFKSLPDVMEEIYRICKDRALVTIIGPYYNTRLNQANPYHLQPFNEHTPRFFSTMPSPAIALDEYAFPFANAWALGQSDNTDWVADFRLLHAEYLYMPAYRGLDPAIQRVLRKTWSDVCDQFSMQMLVVKSPISDDELATLSARETWPSTPYYDARKQEELEVGPRNVLSGLFERQDAAGEALRTAVSKLADQADQITNLQARLDGLAAFASNSAHETSQVFERLKADAAAEALQRARKLAPLSDQVVELIEQTTESKLATARLNRRVGELEQLLAPPESGTPDFADRIAALDTLIGQRGETLAALRAETQSLLDGQIDLGRTVARALDDIQALDERVEATNEIVQPLANFMAQVVGELDGARDELEAMPDRILAEVEERLKNDEDATRNDLIAERITAINATFTRRVLALELKVEDLLGGGTQYTAALQTDVVRLKERETILTDVVVKQAAYLEAALTHVVSAQIAAERRLFGPLARVRTFLKRGRDLRGVLAGGLYGSWLDNPLNAPEQGLRVQMSDYWLPGEGMVFDLGPVSAGFTGVDLAAWAFMPPAFSVEVFAFEIIGADGQPLAYGRAEADKNLGVHCPLKLRCAPLEHDQSNVTVRLHGLQHLERIGVKFYERRKLRPLTRRLIQRRPLAMPVYGCEAGD